MHATGSSKRPNPKVFTKKDQKRLHVKKLKTFHISHLFMSARRRAIMRCPDFNNEFKHVTGKMERSGSDDGDDQEVTPARIVGMTELITFDVIHVETKTLDIPEFKQFKNNMSDFTAAGEEQFQKIIEQLKEYLGDNSKGNGVTLYIKGSASQIPTSYHPNKPNFNINPDGTSIRGETSIENNRFLAHARAMELAYKIKERFTHIEVVTPELEEITIGKTVWDAKTQKALEEAYIAGDREAMDAVFEPFQKDQYVKVLSNDQFIKTVQPNAIKSFSVAAIPRFVLKDGETETIVRAALTVSKETYDKLKSVRSFRTIEARDAFLANNNLRIESTQLGGETRWFIIGTSAEQNALDMTDDEAKVLAMYELGLINLKDYPVLEKAITEKHLREHKYKYKIKAGAPIVAK